MKTLKCLAMAAFAIVAFVFASCGESKSEDAFEVTVDNTVIGGKLSEYFSLVDKTYKYKKGIIDKVTVELTCIEPLSDDMKAYIGVEVLDEEGNVISAGKPNEWSFHDYEKLRQASSGQTVTIEIENHENVGNEKPASIRLSSVLEEDNDEAEQQTDEDEEEEDGNNGSSVDESTDIEELIADLDKCASEWEGLYKRYRNGDITVLEKFNSFADRVQTLSKKLETMEGSLSDEQKKKVEKILWRMNDIQR